MAKIFTQCCSTHTKAAGAEKLHWSTIYSYFKKLCFLAELCIANQNNYIHTCKTLKYKHYVYNTMYGFYCTKLPKATVLLSAPAVQ